MDSSPKPDPPVAGFRADLRRALYGAYRFELGCPGEAQCDLYEARQFKACRECPKLLRPVEDDPRPTSVPRIKHLMTVEGMVTVGCRFAPDDLPWQTWQDLMALKGERNRLDKLVFEQKSRSAQENREIEQARSKARAVDKLPGPGQSIFPRGK